MIDRRIKKTKKIISDTLVSLLQKKEIHQISITELCDQADINRKTFYNHYQGIKDVLNEIEDDYVMKYLSYLRKENKHYDLTNLHPFITRLTEEIDKKASLYMVISKKEEYVYIKEKIKNELSIYLNKIVKNEKKIDHETLFFYIDFITAGISSVYQEWLLSGKKMKKDKLNKLLCQVINNGSQIVLKTLF
jgi:AcrR family transcriptional regulator